MIEVIFSKRFKRNFAQHVKRQPDLELTFQDKFSLFVKNPRDRSLGGDS